MPTRRREWINVVLEEINDREVAERIVDKLTALSTKHNPQKWGAEWAIVAGIGVEQEQVDENVLAQEAKDAFERDMKFNPLPWGSTKGWEKLEKFVIQEYKKDNQIFFKYKTWQMGDGQYISIKNPRITRSPEDFVTNFPDFFAHTASYGQKNTETKESRNLNG